jgi:manganese/zinc/iron transport system permease protein
VDFKTERAIVGLLREIRASGGTVVVVHHDLATVPDYFDQGRDPQQAPRRRGPRGEVFTRENIAEAYGGPWPTRRSEAVLELLRDLLFDYTVRNVALGSAILGFLGGALGSFAVLRRQGLFGDALAHATLPGVCVAFVLTGSKAPIVLLLGAALSAGLGALLILAVVNGTRIKQDAILGIVLSVFFGAGVVLLTYIAGSGDAAQSGLDRFIFGQAATIVRDDVVTMGLLALVALAVTACSSRSSSCSPSIRPSPRLGYPVKGLNVLLTSLIVVAVIVGIQAVGVVLMAAMLITPPPPRGSGRRALDHGPPLRALRRPERGLRRSGERLGLEPPTGRSSCSSPPASWSSRSCWAGGAGSCPPGHARGATAGRP